MSQTTDAEPEQPSKPADLPATDLKEGLSAAEAARRLAQFGLNKLPEKKPKNPFLMFLGQFKDIMIVILLVATLASLVVAIINGEKESWNWGKRELIIDFVQPFIILLVVMANCGLGTWQEMKSARSVKALRAMNVHKAKVRRDGALIEVDAQSLVVGDLITLEAGDYVPADAKLIESANLRVIESALTGESLPVDKNAKAVVAKDAPLGDRLNYVFSSCAVVNGTATAVVTATGGATEIGKISGLIDATEIDLTPLQLKLKKLSRVFGWAAAALFVIVFVVQMGMLIATAGPGVSAAAAADKSWSTALVVAISLAVAAIPEGLSAFTTIILSLGIHNMTKQNVLIKQLTAVETLGSTSVICSDKTGTLTMNKITVQGLYTPADGQAFGTYNSLTQRELVKRAMLCTEGSLQIVDGVEKGVGDPTEVALLSLGRKLGINHEQLADEFPRVRTLPFDSDRKLMTVINKVGNTYWATLKGAPEAVADLCAASDQQTIEAVAAEYSDQAYRTLAVAIRELTEEQVHQLSDREIEQQMQFIGMFAMIDPPREEAKKAVAECWHSGIKTVMITGDHLKTAVAIATQLDIYREGDLAIDSEGLAQLSDEQLAKDIARYSVFARVTPSDKLRIVKAWKANDQVVAMTGDGVNDAPALRAADIGCAMGITGTDVSKEAADMVLMDDNFATIASAVSSGRRIYERIRSVIQNLLISSIAEIIVVFLGSLIFTAVYGARLPQNEGLPNNFAVLSAAQLLWINLLVHGAPGVALGIQASEAQVMGVRPFSKHENIFARRMGIRLMWQGLLISFLAMLAYALCAEYAMANMDAIKAYPAITNTGTSLTSGDIVASYGSTGAFLTIGIGASFHTLNLMSDKSIFRCNVKFYKLVYISVSLSILAILLVALVPQLADVFNMATSWYHFPDIMGYGIGLPFVLTAACELVKLVKLLSSKHHPELKVINDFVMIQRPKSIFKKRVKTSA